MDGGKATSGRDRSADEARAPDAVLRGDPMRISHGMIAYATGSGAVVIRRFGKCGPSG